ncbi:restriction endonuclease subunit S [Kluyvera ascorbata]|uniref:restriction endonuclease subunit S n=1 Tax=Kluyvera ascorbata TaxID=51288 RepID=UPI0022E4D037|nr:restriction endonuclease subunit S [Kluyvera ascorbata]
MDAQQFLAEFGHIANAPGGIRKLRELILQLAVQGKLIESRASNVSSCVLLDEVRALKAELISCKKLPREKPYPEVLRREIAVDAPSHWEWCRFGELWQLLSGRDLEPSKYSNSKNGIPYITGASNIENGIIAVNRWTPSPVVVSITGDLLITCKGTIGKTAFNTLGEIHIARQIMAVRNFSEKLDTGFLKIWLDSFVSQLVEKSRSMIPGFSRDDLVLAAYPVLPINEQSRIVAKADELMALCDKLEAQQQTRHKLQNQLRQSTLQAVARANNQQELQTSWMRLADNFGWLFHAPEDVDEFVVELKNIAVRGLLSLPSTSLSPVDDIMADCDSLRSQYISSGLMRRQKLISVSDSDVVYPAHWAIAPFDKVAVVIGGVTKGRDLRGRDVMTCPYLAVANVQRGFIKLTDLKTIQIGKQELNKYLVQEGDLLITEGGDWDTVGRTAIWQGGVENCLHQNHVFKARVPSLSLLNEWVELVFNSGIGRDYFAGASKQTTNLASINMTQLRSFPMPIPPLDEQRTVLAKLDALTKQADIWRKKLENKKHLALLLASATVAAFTGLTIEQEEEPMKAPQTELIATLRLGKAPDIKAQAPLATILARHHGEMNAKDLWQRFGGDIDAFYAQLKIEVVHGWILEPAPAEVRENTADRVSA